LPRRTGGVLPLPIAPKGAPRSRFASLAVGRWEPPREAEPRPCGLFPTPPYRFDFSSNSIAMAPFQILVVDDHPRSRESVAAVLRQGNYEVTTCTSAVEALARLAVDPVDVVITDLQMPGMDGLEFMAEMSRRQFPCQVLMITAYASIRTAVEAMRVGAFDYLEKPFDATRLEQSVAQACAHGRVVRGETLAASEGTAGDVTMIGASAAMQQLRQQIARIAPTNETVLICGESGTGKELVARALHAASRRADRALVSLNCPVLSEQLTESELFGHRRGAFTGADSDRVGRFELASGGTLLLDEITEINLHLQAKLLRVLQEQRFEPVGSSESQVADVRILATTNRDLPAEMAAGRFREDLYYRLAVVPIELPPLRARRDDIPLLIDHFLSEASRRLGEPLKSLEPQAYDLACEYDWPGNIRELQNVVTRACVMTPQREIPASRLQPWLTATGATQGQESTPPPTTLPLPGEVSLAELERQTILATLERHGGHRARTAEALGIGLRTLSGKLRLYGVGPHEKHLARTP
jgi:DNA-binding NtrC family response regulator